MSMSQIDINKPYTTSLHSAVSASSEILIDGLTCRTLKWSRLANDNSKAGLFAITSNNYHRVTEDKMNRPLVIADQEIQVNANGIAKVYCQEACIVELDGRKVIDTRYVEEKIEVVEIQFILSRGLRKSDIDELDNGTLFRFKNW